MKNKLGFRIIIKKVLLIYSMLILLPISLYIVIFVFPQVPMMTLGYQYDCDFFSPGQNVGDVDVRFSNQTIYLTYWDYSGIHAYRSHDEGYIWIDLLNGSFSYRIVSSRMDVFNDTIGIAYYNEYLHQHFFIYSDNRGVTWSTPRTMPFSFNAIALINSTYLIACSNNYTQGIYDYNSTIYISKDLGLNWEKQTIILSYIEDHHYYTVRVTQNQTIYMYGLSSTNLNNYSIYRSGDLGKAWTEIETDFSGGRLTMGADNEFYVYSNLGNIYKSTDECQTWSHVKVTGVIRFDVSSPVLDISEDGKIFVAYTKEIPRLAFPMYSYYVLDYFWVGQDIWRGRYVSDFFEFFLPAAAVGFFVAVVVYGLYSLYTWDKRNTEILRQKARESVG